MTSKEIIKNQIVALKEQAQIEKELETGNEIYYEAEIKEYNQVLKDLEDYEELKKIMGTPIQDIMKRLKILEILKSHFHSSGKDYENYDFFTFEIDGETEECKLVKEWFSNGKD